MNVDEAFEKGAAAIDERIDAALISDCDAIRARGATEEEISDFLARAQRDYATWREHTLTELRAWLERGGEALQ